MKFFVVTKSTGNSDVINAESKEALLEEYSPADREDIEILTPQEYQEREIKKATKEAYEADNPVLSKLYPRTAENPNSIKSTISDALTIPGRAAGAAIDGVSGDGFVKSLSEAKATDRERGAVGGFVQEMLRDEMLIPSLVIGGPGLGKATTIAAKYIPMIGEGVALAQKPATTMVGKFIKKDIATPIIGNAATGAVIGGLRKPLTGESQFGTDVVGSALGGTAVHNLSRIGSVVGNAGIRIGKSTPFYTAVKEYNAGKDIKRFARKEPSAIIGDIEKDYNVNLDEWSPEISNKVGEISEAQSPYDIANYALRGQRPPTIEEANFIGNKSGTGRDALLKGTSKKGIADIEKAYRSQTAIADDIVDKLSFDNLIGEDYNIWKNFLDNSKEAIPEDKINSLLNALKRPLNEGLAEPGELRKIGKYVKLIESKANTMTAKDLDILRQRIGDDLNWNKTAADTKMMRVEANALNDAYHLARDINFETAINTDNEAAATAYQKNAVAQKLRDDVFHALGVDKGDKRDVSYKMGRIFKSRGDEDSNAIINQRVFETLQNLDDHLGTNYAKQVSDAYLANQLSPQGKEFSIPNYNKHFTGKDPNRSLLEATRDNSTAKAAFVKTARNKAMDLRNFQDPRIIGDVRVPTFSWGNVYGGGKERDRQIQNMPRIGE